MALDLGRRLARLPARPYAGSACTCAPRKPRAVVIATILLLYIDYFAPGRWANIASSFYVCLFTSSIARST